MKKLTAILACALMLGLALTACGPKEPAETGYDPAKVTGALLDSAAFSQPLDTLDLDTACSVQYGIDAADVADGAVYTSLTAGAEEFAVLTLAEGADAQAVKTALEDYLATRREELENYQPEELTKLQNAILEVKGSSVLLVVAADADAARSLIDGIK